MHRFEGLKVFVDIVPELEIGFMMCRPITVRE